MRHNATIEEGRGGGRGGKEGRGGGGEEGGGEAGEGRGIEVLIEYVLTSSSLLHFDSQPTSLCQHQLDLPTVNFTCGSGPYLLQGFPFITCLSRGRWSAPAPTCSES